MKYFSSYTTFLLAVLLIASCNTASKKPSLEKSETRRSEIIQSISDLEKELVQVEKTIAILDTTPKEIRSLPIEVLEVANSEFKHFINLQGSVESENNVLVSPQNPAGIITRVYVKEGQWVKKGALLAEMDASVQKSSLEGLENSLKLASDVFNRQKNLWEKQIGSEMQFLEAKNNKEMLENQIKTVKRQIRMARIYAPISGNVEEVFVKVGQASMNPMAGGSFRIVNMDKLKFAAELSESYLASVRRGDKVEVVFPSLGDTITTKISVIGSSIHPTRRTFKIEAPIPNKSRKLKANMGGEISINDKTLKDIIKIPINYIQSGPRGKYVYVAVEGEKGWIATKRDVKTQLEYGGLAVIESGLKTGDKVISLGYQELSEGQQISF